MKIGASGILFNIIDLEIQHRLLLFEGFLTREKRSDQSFARRRKVNLENISLFKTNCHYITPHFISHLQATLPSQKLTSNAITTSTSNEKQNTKIKNSIKRYLSSQFHFSIQQQGSIPYTMPMKAF
jgi:hypothetical protein